LIATLVLVGERWGMNGVRGDIAFSATFVLP
jgi:hypothetical protein